MFSLPAAASSSRSLLFSGTEEREQARGAHMRLPLALSSSQGRKRGSQPTGLRPLPIDVLLSAPPTVSSGSACCARRFRVLLNGAVCYPPSSFSSTRAPSVPSSSRSHFARAYSAVNVVGSATTPPIAISGELFQTRGRISPDPPRDLDPRAATMLPSNVPA